MTYSHAEVQGLRLVGYEDKVQTNGWTDGRTEAIALPAALMPSVTNGIAPSDVITQPCEMQR